MNMKDFVSRSAAKSHPGYESLSPPSIPTMPSPKGSNSSFEQHWKVVTSIVGALGTIGVLIGVGFTLQSKQDSFATKTETKNELAGIRAQLDDSTKAQVAMHEQLAVQERALVDIQKSVDRIERSLEGANNAAAKRGRPTPFPLQDK